MAVQNPYLYDDGDLNQATRKRAGQSPLVSSLPPVAGNPQRAAQMQAQFDQPVSGPRGVVPAKQNSFDITNTPAARVGGIAAGLANAGSGVVNTAVGAAESLLATPLDAARNTAARVFGGDPATLSGGPSAFRDTAFSRLDKGLDQLSNTGEQVAGIGRDVLGVAPASPGALSANLPSLVPAASAAGRMREPPGSAAPVQKPAVSDPNAWTNADNGIAARVGVNGSPEFSNAVEALTGAQPMPAGGIGGSLKTPGVSNLADNVALEKRGSINNIGNGIGGGLSVGESGDAQMAFGRFERANQERERMIQASRRGEIGEGGGRVTVVRDSSRAPTIAEMINERRERADASAGLDQRRVANDERRTASDIARNSQQTANDQLSQLKIGQEIEAGQLSLDTARQMEALRQQLADPSLDQAQRAQLEAAYYAMNTSAKDRYMAVTGGTNELGGKDASRVFDRRTGQYIDAQGEQKSLDSDQDALAIKNNANLSRDEKVAALKKLGYN